MNFYGLIARFALDARADGTYVPFSAEAWAYAGQMTLLGMVMIFAVLGVLWAVLSVFKLVFAGRSPKQPKAEKPTPIKKEKNVKASVPKKEKAMPVVAPKNNDAELVAIITAAVAAYMAEEGAEYQGGFRVVSFKRVRGGRTWNIK